MQNKYAMNFVNAEENAMRMGTLDARTYAVIELSEKCLETKTVKQ